MRPKIIKNGFQIIKKDDVSALALWIKQEDNNRYYLRMMAFEAARLGKKNSLDVLMETGQININESRGDGSTLLTEACQSKIPRPEIVSYLLKLGADPTGKRSHPKPPISPINMLVNKEKFTLLQALLSSGKVSKEMIDDEKTIGEIVVSNNIPGLKSLLAIGASPNIFIESNQNIKKKTIMSVLTLACFTKRQDCMTLLIEAGADPTLDDKGLEYLSRFPEIYSKWEKEHLNKQLSGVESKSKKIKHL